MVFSSSVFWHVHPSPTGKPFSIAETHREPAESCRAEAERSTTFFIGEKQVRRSMQSPITKFEFQLRCFLWPLACSDLVANVYRTAHKSTSSPLAIPLLFFHSFLHGSSAADEPAFTSRLYDEDQRTTEQLAIGHHAVVWMLSESTALAKSDLPARGKVDQ